MRVRHKAAAIVSAALLLLSACAERSGVEGPTGGPGELPGPVSTGTEQSQPIGEAESIAAEPGAEPQAGESYIHQLVAETVAQFQEPGMTEYEKAKAAFDYMIETATLVDPVGLELWRIRGDNMAPPSFVENRSLSILLYGMGMCEDYAAALTLLLRGMGLEAEYVPGLTYSSQGELVDHAWTMVRVDGVWYHLDCQLEQNISRHGSIRYKYFMRGDATMGESHRWSQNLIHSGLLTAAQNGEIAECYMLPECPQNYPTPERRSFTSAPAPDRAAILAEIEAELRDYEAANGPLEPLELNVIPPVFGLEGYGPQE